MYIKYSHVENAMKILQITQTLQTYVTNFF